MTRSISSVLREAAMGPSMGEMLGHWLPFQCPTMDSAFMFVWEQFPHGMTREFQTMKDAERRAFLYLCSLIAEDEE